MIPGHPHIGEMIAARLAELGMTKAEFGRRIKTSRQNVSLILAREVLDSGTIWKSSRVLGVNFFDLIGEALCTAHGVGDDGKAEVASEVEVKLRIPNSEVLGAVVRLVEGLTTSTHREIS